MSQLRSTPRTNSEEQLETLARIGFNRISMGVQDFNPDVQKLVNRIQPYELTAEVCEQSRKHGFESINVDLIYGLPNQTLEGFERSIEQVLEIRPERVALYGYAHVTWIKKVQKALERAHLPTPKERIALFLKAVEMFSAAGYEYIGMDHFALPEDELAVAEREGHLNRNFMGYSTHRGARLIGFGASSISTIPGAMAQNEKDVGAYQERISKGELAVSRGLVRSTEDQIRGDLIERLLCQRKVSLSELESTWGVDFQEFFNSDIAKLKPMIEDGPRLGHRKQCRADSARLAFQPPGCNGL